MSKPLHHRIPDRNGDIARVCDALKGEGRTNTSIILGCFATLADLLEDNPDTHIGRRILMFAEEDRARQLEIQRLGKSRG